MKIPSILLPLLLLLVIQSCDSHRYFDESVKIPDDGWHKDSTAFFNVEIEDTIRFYSFFINLRNNNDYPYSNFYLFLNSRLPDGDLAKDTIELTLADRTGRWLGKGFGRIRDNQIKVRSRLKFPRKGSYVFEIEQAMRDTTLAGIESVGIRIERE